MTKRTPNVKSKISAAEKSVIQAAGRLIIAHDLCLSCNTIDLTHDKLARAVRRLWKLKKEIPW